MVDVNDRILTEATHRGDSLVVDDFMRLVEQYHAHEQPGVAWETLEAYATELDNTDGGARFDADEFLSKTEERLTDGDAAYSTDALYRLDDDRVSAYPRSWHDALAGETDLREFVRFLGDLDPDPGAELGGSGRGVPESVLLDAAGILGGTDPGTVKSTLEDLRDRGELVEDADQHPNARVRLADRADDYRNEDLDS